MPRYIDADAFFADFPEIRDYEYASQEYEADVVERKKGKWVLIGSRLESRPFACSDCNYAFQVDTVMGKPAWGFCPNCGAAMETDEKA